jgi:hypothetical protein
MGNVTVLLRKGSLPMHVISDPFTKKEKGKYFMKSIRIFYFVVLVFVVLGVRSARAGGGWQVVPSPNLGTQANTLLSVAAAAEDDVWAVGAGYDQGLYAYRTVIEHWNGAVWSITPSPNATGGYNILNGVAVAGPKDIWTVGQAAEGNTYSTLVEHSTGGKVPAWNIVPSPNVAGSSSVLNAISVVAANDLWAVGYSTDGNFNNHALIMHWDGAVWSIIPSPTVGNNDILYAVNGVASNDVWATGRTAVGYSSSRTLTLHWDGSTWTVIPSPNDSTTHNNLYGVAAIAPNDVWAVGAAGSLKTLAIHWDGTSWSVSPAASFGSNVSNEALVGIVAATSGDIWTAGQFYQNSAEQTLTEHWNGSTWMIIPSPDAESSNNRLQGIARSPKGTLWAVGTTGVFGQPERTLILRRSGITARN